MSIISKENWKPQGISTLEDNALIALRETEHSVLVTASAGSGKTEFLAQKATYLLQTGLCPDPKRILAISFKKDAASNLAERVEKRCPRKQSQRFNSMTFDAFTKGLFDRFRAALPPPYNSPKPYKIITPTFDDFEYFLSSHGFSSKITKKDFESSIRKNDLPINLTNDSVQKKALYQYWKEQFCNHDKILLSF